MKQKAQMMTAMLNAKELWPSSSQGHVAILGNIHRLLRVDYMVSYNLVAKSHCSVISTTDYRSRNNKVVSGILRIYSDGSTLLGKVEFDVSL